MAGVEKTSVSPAGWSKDGLAQKIPPYLLYRGRVFFIKPQKLFSEQSDRGSRTTCEVERQNGCEHARNVHNSHCSNEPTKHRGDAQHRICRDGHQKR